MKNWKSQLAPFRKHKRQVFENAGKVASFIYQIGESEDLRKPSTEIPVNEITSLEYQKKFKYIKNCLRKYRKLTGMGRGITAVQIGIPERFSVIYTEEKLIIIINPKINKISKEKLKYPEMCMSANPVIVPTARPAWIEFEYLDEKGNLQYWTDKDKMLNRVFQHEIDHMNGIINLDIGNPKEFILEADPKFYQNAKFEKV
ncbi:MAG: peptide deformylase [Candidatus Daviesbacteria bacterium]|nr:peptide deformylase [Candidatus Daviesbacteria bacterium]